MPTLPTDRLADRVAAKRADARIPGIAAAIVRDGGIAWFAGEGRADLDRDDPPTEGSLGRVASVTKTFTATAILQLRDRGLLALDDPLTAHLPEFAAVQERGGRRSDVTIRRLLTHRSGLVTESPPTHWDGPAGPEFPSRDAILAALPQTAVVIPADSAFKYSNLAFALLGEVVARLGGRPYPEHVRAEIFEPLGMLSSSFEPGRTVRARAMTGYSPTPHADRATPAPTTSLHGLTSAGQLWTSVGDLARWVAFQVRGDGLVADGGPRILSAASHEDSFRPLYVEPDLSMAQCLAWRVNRVGTHAFHNHGGSVHGFNTSVSFHRPSRTGAIVLMNLWPTTSAAELAFDLLDVAIGGPGARTWPAADDEPPAPVPESVRPFLGRFRAEPGVDVEVAWRDGALRFLAPPGAFPLHVPGELARLPGRDGAFRVLTGRGAGEEIAFDDAANAFELGGFRYERSR
jgi:CubicO group peptidase (beta-lactamase class C family)